ncbi:MAG: sugar transferase [Bacteroidales bacterium]
MTIINRTRIIFAIFDIILVAGSTLFTAWLHDGLTFAHRDGSYFFAFMTFPVIWILLSFITRKFRIGEKSSQMDVFLSVLFSNFVILSFTTLVMVLFGLTYFSRFILFGTVAGITLIELLTGIFYVSVQKSVYIRDWMGLDILPAAPVITTVPSPREPHAIPPNFSSLRDSMVEESGDRVFTWIWSHIDIGDPKTLITSTDTRFNIINQPGNHFFALVNLHPVNNLRRINKFFETVNEKLTDNGIFIGCGETYTLRKMRILAKFPPVINYMVYTIDFIVHRVFPKLVMTNKLYFLITGGKKRVISRTETLGRLYSCGFEVLEEKSIENLLYFRARKTGKPAFDPDPTYGVFIHLRRIGKNGREFSVYKLRTMHAYSEYLQGYVYQLNQLADGGKFANDFRVTTLGRFFRKFWLDELPMILNVMKGDMKIVGVRPLSRHYFSLYTPELQEKRTRTKPGLIPPYYAQYPTPVSIEDVQKNEWDYLDAWEKHPFKTDFKYFWTALYNIFLKRARSK